MTIELHGFVEILNPSMPVVPAPRSFSRMNERFAVYHEMHAENNAAGDVEGFNELNRRGRLAQLQKRRDALAVIPGEQVQYVISDESNPTTMRH